MQQARKEINSDNKILKKVKGHWVAALCSLTVMVAVPLVNPVTAGAETLESSIQVYDDNNSSNFASKESYQELPLVQEESQKAINGITDEWSMKAPEEITQEIQRQQGLGLSVYVIQWGDTIPAIADALGIDSFDLIAWNGLQDADHIITGDILTLEDPSLRDAAVTDLPQGGAEATENVEASGTVLEPAEVQTETAQPTEDEAGVEEGDSNENTPSNDLSNDDVSNDDGASGDDADGEDSNDVSNDDVPSNDDVSNEDTPSDDDAENEDSNEDTPSDDDADGEDTPSNEDAEDDDSNEDTPSDGDADGEDSIEDTPSDDDAENDDSNDDVPSDDDAENDDSNDDTPSDEDGEGDDSNDDTPSDDELGDDESGDDAPTPSEPGAEEPNPEEPGTDDQIGFNTSLVQNLIFGLVNRHRVSNGLPELVQAPSLQSGAELRAREMADHGDLRYIDENGVQHAHTRPDGSSWTTAFEGYESRLGENIAQISVSSGQDFLPEDEVAQRLFDSWSGSAGHNAQMLDPAYNSLAVGVAFGEGSLTRPGEMSNYIGVQIFGGGSEASTQSAAQETAVTVTADTAESGVQEVAEPIAAQADTYEPVYEAAESETVTEDVVEPAVEQELFAEPVYEEVPVVEEVAVETAVEIAAEEAPLETVDSFQ